MARPDMGVSGGGEEGGGVVDGAGVAVQPAGEPVGVAVGEFVEQRGSGVDQVEPLAGRRWWPGRWYWCATANTARRYSAHGRAAGPAAG